MRQQTEREVPAEGAWWDTPAHADFLLADAARQFAFFLPALDARGGFHAQDLAGRPVPGALRELHATTRMVHSYALGWMAGLKGADEMIDHGLASLWKHHRDTRHGGYAWGFAEGGGIADGRKLAYGHAFVLLAGASAKLAGHPDADRLIADVREVIDTRFWDHRLGRMNEEYAEDWQPFSGYRGMNANMHMSEALLGAAEATGDLSLASRARSIFGFFVGGMGQAAGWRLPEHFTESWQVDPDYLGDPMFRPQGSTPGHSFEFARLILQLWDLEGRRDDSLPEWSQALWERALSDGRDPQGGIFYTVDDTGRPKVRSRYWWPVTEAIGAGAALIKAGVTEVSDDYRGFWADAERLFIDKARGGWFPEVDSKGRPDGRQFTGKPDIYHSLQAALYPLLPGIAGLAKGMGSLKGRLPVP